MNGKLIAISLVEMVNKKIIDFPDITIRRPLGRYKYVYLCSVYSYSAHLCSVYLWSVYSCSMYLFSVYLCSVLLRSVYLCSVY